MQNSMTPYQPGPNIDSTTALLIGMKQKGTLQSYVASHRGTPEYPSLLALASSINNISAAGEAAKAQPPTQTVADQRLASLAPQQQAPSAQGLPENSGIGQLPADNLKGMAGGGIVAFDEGGHVPSYAGYTDGSVVQSTVPQALPGGLGIYSQGSFSPQAGDAALQQRIARIEGNTRMARTDKDMLIAQARQEFGVPKTTTIPPTTPVAMSDKVANTSPLINQDQSAVAKAIAQKKAEDDTSVVDKAVERKRIEDEAAAKGQKLPAEPGLPSLNAAVKQYEGTVYKNSPDKAALEKEFAAIDKPVTDAMRSGIEKETARLKTDKEQDFYMSLIQGGLAAAGGTSQYALQNIAQGAEKGASHYSAALKDFRKATQENTKAETELARYEATGKKDALKSYNEQIAKRDDRYAQGVSALMQQDISSRATLGAAKIGRDSMSDYRNQAQVENIRKNVDAKLGDDPKFKFNAAARAVEVERRLQLELQRYPNLVGYAGPPTAGGASGASNQGWGQAQIVK